MKNNIISKSQTRRNMDVATKADGGDVTPTLIMSKPTEAIAKINKKGERGSP